MWRSIAVSLAIAALIVVLGVVMSRGNAPRRAYDRCMASITAAAPGGIIVDDADCQPLLRGQR